MAAEVNFEQHRGLLMSLAHRVSRRMYSAGNHSIQLEDVFSELCVAWCIARDAWKPEFNVPFGAFLARGIKNHINRWADKEILAHNWSHLDLDAPLGDSDEGSGDAHGIIGDTAGTADEITERKDSWEKNLECLSPEARKFVELLASPPPALFVILEAQQAKRQYAKDRGITVGFIFRKVTTSLVCEVMGLRRQDADRITREIKLILNLQEMANG